MTGQRKTAGNIKQSGNYQLIFNGGGGPTEAAPTEMITYYNQQITAQNIVSSRRRQQTIDAVPLSSRVVTNPSAARKASQSRNGNASQQHSGQQHLAVSALNKTVY